MLIPSELRFKIRNTTQRPADKEHVKCRLLSDGICPKDIKRIFWPMPVELSAVQVL